MDKIALKKTKFFKDTPSDINPDALVILILKAYEECTGNEEKNYVDSKLNSYKKNPQMGEWYGFFAELVYRDWIKAAFDDTSVRVIFAQKHNNDLQIITESRSYSVEIKAILPGDIERMKMKQLREIRNIPSGKAFAISSSFSQMDGIVSGEYISKYFSEIVEYIKEGTPSNHWKIEEIGKIKDKTKTGFLGPIQSVWMDSKMVNNITRKVHNHIFKNSGGMRKQIEKADIVGFHIFDGNYDSEDIIEIFDKLYTSDHGKIFCFFTKWQGGKPIFIRPKTKPDETIDQLIKHHEQIH